MIYSDKKHIFETKLFLNTSEFNFKVDTMYREIKKMRLLKKGC
ncbi:MAG: hypothetical protein ACFWTJ_15085 [Lachnoclostridium sp.]|jgi:hypothetical protein